MATPFTGQSPASLLNQIRPRPGTERFLQAWEPTLGTLWFGCGDGQTSVSISSRRWLVTPKRGQLTLASSRLPPAVIHRFRSAASRSVSGNDLLTQIADVFERYIHVVDSRVYRLLGLWVMGTYVY